MKRRSASFTAECVAAMRATEQRRPDAYRLFDDPQAERVLSPPMRTLMRVARTSLRNGFRPPGLTTAVVLRHAFLEQLVRTSGAEQLVILGAGFDTRNRRFPMLRSFLVDHPETAAARREKLGPEPAGSVTASTDFLTQSLEDVLTKAGLRRDLPTVITWEGVTMYLSQEAIHQTLATLAVGWSAPVDLGLDVLAVPAMWRSGLPLSRAALRLLGEPLLYTPKPGELEQVLNEHGFEVVRSASIDALRREAAGWGPPQPPSLTLIHARIA